jgi:hypothetical protein
MKPINSSFSSSLIMSSTQRPSISFLTATMNVDKLARRSSSTRSSSASYWPSALYYRASPDTGTYRNDGRLATSSVDIEESIHKLLINRHPRPMRFDLVEKFLDPSLACLFMRIPLTLSVLLNILPWRLTRLESSFIQLIKPTSGCKSSKPFSSTSPSLSSLYVDMKRAKIFSYV